jgi:hypothetical protein
MASCLPQVFLPLGHFSLRIQIKGWKESARLKACRFAWAGFRAMEFVVTHRRRNKRAKTWAPQMDHRNPPDDAAIHGTQINLRTDCQATFNCV